MSEPVCVWNPNLRVGRAHTIIDNEDTRDWPLPVGAEITLLEAESGLQTRGWVDEFVVRNGYEYALVRVDYAATHVAVGGSKEDA